MATLDAILDDLAALMDTHIVNRHQSTSDPISKLLSYHGSKKPSTNPQIVDVMRHHRTLIEEALRAVERVPASAHVPINLNNRQLVSMPDGDTSSFDVLLDRWKTGAFKLAVQLNAVTFAFQGAHQRLLACTLGVQRGDMTGCEPGFITEFYTDVPIASRLLSPSGLVMVVKRERWRPLALSRWYMSFVDYSKGNRTCWLDRPMVSDTHANYREPACDSRGICEPLERDDDTVSACEVNENGEISLECPVVCGAPCFGPICYQPGSDAYALRTASGGALDINATGSPRVVRVAKSPRILSRVYSLSDLDIRTSLDSIQNRYAQSSQLLKLGDALLQDVIAMDATARKYIAQYAENTASRSSRGMTRVDCESMIGHNRTMAVVSLTLSALTCPLLLMVVILKLKSSTNNRRIPVRTPNRSATETF